MKKRKMPGFKYSLIFLMILFLISFGMSCFATAGELKPCSVDVSIVETIYAGTECVCFSPVFKVSNPNSKEVHLPMFSYELNIKDFYFAGQQIPVNLYIPPGKSISFTGSLPAAWAGMSLWLMQIKGVSMAEGMKEVLPLWKGWGAKLFNNKLKGLWEKAEPEKARFVFSGEFETVMDEISSRFPYKASWIME